MTRLIPITLTVRITLTIRRAAVWFCVLFSALPLLAAQENAPAELTIYAKEPDRVKHLKDRDSDTKIPHYILPGDHRDMVGHSFWRCNIIGNSTGGDLAGSITENRPLTAAEKRLNGHCFGLYPRGGLGSPYHTVSIVDGILGTDDHHSVSASITCPIDRQAAGKILAKTDETVRNPQ